MSIFGHLLFWSAIACVLGAVVVCALVLRYGFTRDSDPAGRWGWRPTRAGHGLAAALFGTGVVLAILALTAVPLGGKERQLGIGDALRARLDSLRGQLSAIEGVMERLGEFGGATNRGASRRMPMAPGRSWPCRVTSRAGAPRWGRRLRHGCYSLQRSPSNDRPSRRPPRASAAGGPRRSPSRVAWSSARWPRRRRRPWSRRRPRRWCRRPLPPRLP